MRRARLAGPAPDSAPTSAAGTAAAVPAGATGQPRRWLLPVTIAAVVAAVTAGLAGTPAGDVLSWWVPAAAGAVAGVGVMLLTRRAWRADDAAPPASPVPTALQSGYALLISTGVAISSLFWPATPRTTSTTSVSRSGWPSVTWCPPTTSCSPRTSLPAMGSQPPTPSIEVFDGALAHVLGIHAASATWYLALPVMAVRGRPGAVAAHPPVGPAPCRCSPSPSRSPTSTWSPVLDAALGTFHLPRLHEGKGMFVSAVIPLMWLYLTEWFDTRSRRALLLIVALSITATGLTTTSAIVLPLLVGARRASR